MARPGFALLDALGVALGESRPADDGEARAQWDIDTFAVASAVGDGEGHIRRRALAVVARKAERGEYWSGVGGGR